jgi:translation initiation factor IF-1
MNKTYSPETVIAEKFEAMVRFGAADGRLKDFNDIWAISKTFDFEMATLAQAMIGTFARRETALPTDIPFALTAEFAVLEDKRKMWDAFRSRPSDTFDRHEPSRQERSMAKEELLEMDGTVLERLPDARYGVRLDNGHETIAYMAGRVKKNRIRIRIRIRILAGDRVTIEMTPYDLTKG